MKTFRILFFSLFTASVLVGQILELPAPQKTGGMPLMEALSKRVTVRSFDTTDISMQQLSGLLWASFGVSRPDGRRTAPSANNKQEVDIYVLLRNGAYLYDAQNNALVRVSPEDLRSQAADKQFADAPVQLIFIADLSKRGDNTEEGKMRMAYIDCGCISQNTYLYCASEGLVTGARATVNRDPLVSKLRLTSDQRILLAHSVGRPKQ